ncbi:urea carboxylase-associated family protein [Dehalococcoidia bacterium]|jgi:uncharacterized protein YcgI (DUF1989 family)|nr:urea carboxylase-associated family protein [Dehalococcoidia bacterium]
MTKEITTIPARSGKATWVDKGFFVKVINTLGEQVVDTWAFNAKDVSEFMSMEHSRVHFSKLRPKVGDSFTTNQRRPILTLVKDTSPGIHDTLVAACDESRYKLLGSVKYHQNCTDNLSAGMAELGLKEPETPAPLNLFMNVPWTEKGDLTLERPVSRPGDYVLFKVEMDAVLAFSACPQDFIPINGPSQQPTEAHFQILPSA